MNFPICTSLILHCSMPTSRSLRRTLLAIHTEVHFKADPLYHKTALFISKTIQIIGEKNSRMHFKQEKLSSYSCKLERKSMYIRERRDMKKNVTLNTVEQQTSYDWLPRSLGKLTSASGTGIKRCKGSELIGTYWQHFEEYSQYHLYMEGFPGEPLLTTRTGEKAVGGILRENTGGALIVLPWLEISGDEFEWLDTESEEYFWTEKGKELGAKFVSALIEIDRSLTSSTELTPRPDWAQAETYETQQEKSLRIEINRLKASLEQVQQELSDREIELDGAGKLRDLLYEKGPRLEEAIIEALQLMGFVAKPYKDNTSEFDVVFEAAEGRFLGEAEGRDHASINVEKLRQLDMNIQEDFEREEVRVHAKGVLFGNAHRLTAPEARGESFTEKCKSAAARSHVALV